VCTILVERGSGLLEYEYRPYAHAALYMFKEGKFGECLKIIIGEFGFPGC